MFLIRTISSCFSLCTVRRWIFGILVQAAQDFGVHAGDPGRASPEAGPVRVLAGAFQDQADAPLDLGQVHAPFRFRSSDSFVSVRSSRCAAARPAQDVLQRQALSAGQGQAILVFGLGVERSGRRARPS